MASIRKRSLNGEARWDVTVTRRGAPRQTRTFRTKAAAERWARETERDIERGAWRSTAMAERTTLAQLLERYRDEVAPTKKSAHDLKGRLNRLRDFDIARLNLIAVTPERLVQFRESRLRTRVRLGGPRGKTLRPIATQTVRHELKLIGTVIKHAMREWGLELPAGDPLRNVKLPPQGRPRDRRTQGDEYERILNEARASKSARLAPAIELAVETSMRRGEICNLVWRDIDLDRRVARCRETKNGEPRDVALSRRAVEVLKSLPRHDGDNGAAVIGIRPGSFSQAFKRVCERLELENIRLHDLRHEAASRLAEKLNGDVIALSTMTGHKTLSMLKRYTHLRAEDVAKRLD
ncbi:integrase [Sinimarinibacterium flocculans]|uniref:Phage integrase family protein n=1 Tax=Sinimarinibacterium flocculans TaxID=985250 RepID=A0A318E2C8_9GAMM|nr:site-specific integrase [Sinimarinibacterium flocculans]MEC9362912.1 site-specific integrase [Pseudomonadota bacterium]PXV63997.1 phage integrase family protein [Sinimarinibacterium flocculans]